jgi:hypothetical protein
MTPTQHSPLSPQAELLEDGRTASIKAIAEHLRIIYRLRLATSESCGSPTVGSNSCPPPPDPVQLAGDVLFDLARVQLGTYTGLLKLSSDYSDKMVHALRSLLAPRGAVPASAGRVLHVRGPGGHAATSEFIVTNGLRRTAYVSFLVSEFTPEEGGQPFGAATAFRAVAPPPTGDERCLQPGERRRFVLTLSLVPPFAAGHAYAAKLHAAVGGCVPEELAILVDVA